jgi:hypothetical protein
VGEKPMPFRPYPRQRIPPGVRLNVSKHGAGVTLGPRALRYALSPTGPRTAVVASGLPGLYYTHTERGPSRRLAGPRAMLGLGALFYVACALVVVVGAMAIKQSPPLSPDIGPPIFHCQLLAGERF